MRPSPHHVEETPAYHQADPDFQEIRHLTYFTISQPIIIYHFVQDK
ncbi:hypothetical protein CHCC20335_0902 [Bacillus paralicheniformis]|nr:hypothetical protein CHCC20335_0902 [Bacillus paralicheniformis]